MLKHGQARHGHISTEYYCWVGMKRRCYNPNAKDYPPYGGRGITMCDEWRNSFEQFLSDMGPRPIGMQIDRIDNGLGYSKSNCRWATLMEQSRNRRCNVYITAFNETHLAADWATIIGVVQGTIYHCVKRGETLEAMMVRRWKRGGHGSVLLTT